MIHSKISPFQRVYRKPKKNKEKKKILERIVLVQSANRAAFNALHKRIISVVPPVYVYPIKAVLRIRAAVLIQAWFKGVFVRREQKRIFLQPGKLMRNIVWKQIKLENTKYADYVCVIRAVNKLRQFYIWFKVKRRIAALTAISNHVSNIDQSQILLDQNIYHNLQKVIDMNTRQPGCLPEAKLIKYKLEYGKIAVKIDWDRYYDD